MLKSLFRKKSITALHNEIQKSHEHSLHKVLTVRDLTAFGIAAIIGAGIFSTIGTASAEGGPGVIFLLFLQRLPAVLQHFATLNLQA
jgi:APA family basic amino acid/polyamine antiporter